MKTIITTIRLTFAILFLSTMFIACESTSIQDEVGIEEQKASGEHEEEINEENNHENGDS